MATRKLTAAEAWRAIAEKLLTEREVRSGLCLEALLLWYDARISTRTRIAMRDQVEQHITPGTFAYPHGRCYQDRAMAALWLALEAEA